MIEEYKEIDLKIYHETLKNGLNIYYLPNKKKNYYISITTLFGSNNLDFIPYNDNKLHHYPQGIAHYLEHEMFEMEDGSVPFDFYSTYGTEVNASTSTEHTKFYIMGTKSIKKNFNYLINLVFKPYFNEEKINKECGIITEEIKMYDDDVINEIYYQAYNNIFTSNNCRYKPAGTINSIKEINKELLEECYYTFYQPKNMIICISGNFNLNEMHEFINNNYLLNQKIDYPIINKEINETSKVVVSEDVITKNVALSKVSLSFKIDSNELNFIELIKLKLYIYIYFAILFDNTSAFYFNGKKNNLFYDFYLNFDQIDNIILINCDSETDNYKEFKEEVFNTIKNTKVLEKDFIRMQNVYIANEIRINDNHKIILNDIIKDIIKYQKPYFNRLEIIKSLNYNEMISIINKLDLGNYSYLVVNKE